MKTYPSLSASRVLCLGLVCIAATGLRAGHPSPSAWRDQNIYFVFTDRFNDGDPANNNSDSAQGFSAADKTGIHGGDFKGVQDKLDYIKALGATTIWITPVPQNVGRSAYHGYGAHDFKKVAPHLGSMTELSNMVAAAHAKGMYVVLDIVCNHTGDRIDSGDAGFPAYKDSGYNMRWRSATQYPAPFNSLTWFNNRGKIDDYNNQSHCELGDVSSLDDLRTDTSYVRTNMVDIYKFWIDQADFDGFRIDTVKHVDMGFWQHFNPAIRAHAAARGKSNFFQFGEALTGSESLCGRYTGTKAGGAFTGDSVLDYPLWFKVKSVFNEGSGNTKQLEDHFNAIDANYDAAAHYRLVTFLDNHDQTRFMKTSNNNTNRLHLAMTFLYTSRGIPCLYYGTEQDFNGGGDPYNREDMFDGEFEPGNAAGDNFNMTKPSFRHVAKLNNFRRLYPSLMRGEHKNKWYDADSPGLFAYSRVLGDEEVIVVLNTSESSQTLPARSTIYAAGTKLVNLLNTNETITVGSGATGLPSISVGGLSAKLFIAQSMWKPLDPVVVSQNIPHAAVNVPTTTNLTLKFSKAMNKASVEGAFTTQPAVSGTFAWNGAGDQVTFTPVYPGLPGTTKVTFKVGTGAKDVENLRSFYAPFETFVKTATGAVVDAVAPWLDVATPDAGSTMTGDIVFSGIATDNVGVVSVQVRMDQQDWHTVQGTTNWSYTFESESMLNGSHELMARALDAAGNAFDYGLVCFSRNLPGPYDTAVSSGNASNALHCDGSTWLRDRAYQHQSFGYIGGTGTATTNAINNVCAQGQSLFRHERYGQNASTLRYVFDCPPGLYEVTLLDAETYFNSTNARVFDVDIESSRVVDDLDLYARAGGKNIPVTMVFTTVVADAELDVSLTPQKDSPRLTGVRVRKIGEADSDEDGTPDWWMLWHFNHADGRAADFTRPEDDLDGDGYSNIDEYIALTNPQDIGSYPRLEAGVDGVGISTAPGRLYDIERCDAFGTSNDWKTVEANLPGIGSWLPVPMATTNEQGFYRIRVRGTPNMSP